VIKATDPKFKVEDVEAFLKTLSPRSTVVVPTR
jgi:hypothetical protein